MQPDQNPWATAPKKPAKHMKIEDLIERIIFASRWVLAIFYLGLVGCLVILAIRFAEHFGIFALAALHSNETSFLLEILKLVDMTLLGNLLLVIIFSGYENFVSIIGVAHDSPDRPKWMGGIDFAGLKLKLISSLVALSGINLLGAFLEIKNANKQDLAWMIGLHLVFVITGLLFALAERVSRHKTDAH